MYDDGFNERTNFIHNALDKNKIEKLGSTKIDSSFAQSNVESHKNDVKTVNTNQGEIITETSGNKENFVIRNKNMINAQNMFREQAMSNIINKKN